MTYAICLGLIVLSQVADYASTLYGIHHGASEVNPLVRAFGLVNSKLFVIGLSAVLLAIANTRGRIMLTLGVVVVYAIVAIHNFLVVR